MKEKLKGILIGIVIGAMLVPTSHALVATVTKELFYNDIKITLDGNEVKPTDGNGNYVEPFSIDGTTYLPIRGIANALDLDVDWNGESNTVVINKKNNVDVETIYAKNISWQCDHQNMAVINLGIGPYDDAKENLNFYLDEHFPDLPNDARNIKWIEYSDYGTYYLFVPRYKALSTIKKLQWNWDICEAEEVSTIDSVKDGAPFVIRDFSIADGGPIFRVYYDGKECCSVYEDLSGAPRLGFECKEIFDLTDWFYYVH